MERRDIYDYNRQKKGYTKERSIPLESDEFVLVVQALIFNSEGKLLIQQRSHEKIGWPDRWDITTGGGALAGETGAQAIERELFEEVGIRHDFTGIRPHVSNNFENGFTDVYLITKDVDITSLKLQTEEVQAVKWASKEEILSMIEDGSFVNYTPEWISYLFAGRFHYGAFEKYIEK